MAWRRYLLACGAVATLATWAPGGWHGVAIGAIQVFSLVAVVVGLAWHRPESVSPWLLLLVIRPAGLALVAVLPEQSTRSAPTAAGIAALAILAYPLWGLGMALVCRGRPVHLSWNGVIDAAAIVGVLAIIFWQLVIAPLAEAGRLAQPRDGLTMVSVLVDVVILVATLRVLRARTRRSPANFLIAGAALALIAGDTLGYSASGSSTPAQLWTLAAVMLGAACLHPSIARLPDDTEEHLPDGPPRVGRWTPAVLTGPFLVVASPAVVATAGVAGTWPGAAVGAGLTGLVAVLAVVRFGQAAGRARHESDQLAREASILAGRAHGLSAQADAKDAALRAQRELEQELAYRATHDPLTMIANRALLTQRLDQALAAVGRHSGLALLVLDLDGFKPVNDNYGHPAGDELLRAVARRLAAVVPATQTLARLGGDEFAILLTGVGESAEALALARAAIAAVGPPYSLHGQVVSVTASIGVRHLPRFRHESAADVMRHADMALYAAKRGGKNQARLYGEEPAETADIRTAGPSPVASVASTGERLDG